MTSVPATPLIVLDTGTWNQLADVGPFVRNFTGSRKSSSITTGRKMISCDAISWIPAWKRPVAGVRCDSRRSACS